MYKTKRYTRIEKHSPTVDAVLAYIYQKQDLLSRCGEYASRVIEGLVDLGLVKKVDSKKGTFYFKTDKSLGFKAIDFAKEFVWAYHNPTERTVQDNHKMILCFDNEIDSGHGLVDIEKAIRRAYV